MHIRSRGRLRRDCCPICQCFIPSQHRETEDARHVIPTQPGTSVSDVSRLLHADCVFTAKIQSWRCALRHAQFVEWQHEPLRQCDMVTGL